MKFKFNKNLNYQIEAINSIVNIFDTGQNFNRKSSTDLELHPWEKVVANELVIDEIRFLANIKSIQENNGIEEKSEKLESMDFSIEMETGTGKTYVYLRTIMELNQKYGLRKFIVLVPSVAIREGVLKTLDQTKEHFREIYNTNYGYFAYDSSKLSQVREFTQSIDIQIMVMTVQSFNKDQNVMRQTPDRFNGESPLEMVATTRPVVILDEPQNMESELSKSAINDLNSLFKLRYSATHKEKHNLMYVLSPADAYQKGLVKKIEVYGVEESDSNEMLFKVREIKTKKGESPTAKVVLEVKNADGEYVNKPVTIKHGDSLFRKSKKNDKYGDLQVNEISAQHNRVELSDGKFYKLEEETSENKEAIFRTQIRETIKAHFSKQEELGENIKVLSLFFIDKVENYMSDSGIIRQIFIDEYNKLKTNYDHFSHMAVEDVHNGYFANQKYKGELIYKDTTGKSKADKEVYDLIMKDKEKLLSFDEPTCFIFSHSALKEGWDNPNVFQICTLNETKSQAKKRQEIGRGLRLCLNIDGDRQFDPNINILTVVANESYKDFVGGLQTEYIDAGYKSSVPAANARRRVNVKFRKHLASDNKDFKQLWDKIRKRTKYNIDFDEQRLISKVVDKINELDVTNLVVRVEKVLVDFANGGKLKMIDRRESAGERLNAKIHIGNAINRIVKETEITKHTIIEILSNIGNLDLLFENPEEFTRSVIVLIQTAKNELLINEGLKYTPVDDVWEISLFEDMKGYQKNTLDSQKSAYERVLCDSKQELEFAHNLEISNRVKLYTKLPPKFAVDTPLGTFNPDWAIVVKTDEGDKLYLVRETKFVDDLSNLRPSELQKIICGEKHFEAIGVDFKVSQKPNLNDLI